MIKKGLTSIIFILACTSAVSAYSNGYEIVKNIKTCIGIEDVRIIRATGFDKVLREWIKSEADNENRSVTLQRDKTGAYIAISLPKVKNSTFNDDIFKKIEDCINAKDVCIMETKNSKLIKTWMKEEEYKKRNISINYEKKTGIYTAVSTP